ncbi:MAG TPA: hypothetical protein PKD90_19715, partial [Phnomibacter sp.]|nr:hypothetical protein [Phnomibacter sp.]
LVRIDGGVGTRTYVKADCNLTFDDLGNPHEIKITTSNPFGGGIAISAIVTEQMPFVPNRSLTTLSKIRDNLGGNLLWITSLLTGCSVLLLDWGGCISMAHLQPGTQADYGALHATGDAKWWATYKAKQLKQEAKALGRNNVDHLSQKLPKRYILVSSQQATSKHQRMQVVGVWSTHSAKWKFYVQVHDYHTKQILEYKKLNWSRW